MGLYTFFPLCVTQHASDTCAITVWCITESKCHLSIWGRGIHRCVVCLTYQKVWQWERGGQIDTPGKTSLVRLSCGHQATRKQWANPAHWKNKKKRCEPPQGVSHRPNLTSSWGERACLHLWALLLLTSQTSFSFYLTKHQAVAFISCFLSYFLLRDWQDVKSVVWCHQPQHKLTGTYKNFCPEGHPVSCTSRGGEKHWAYKYQYTWMFIWHSNLCYRIMLRVMKIYWVWYLIMQYVQDSLVEPHFTSSTQDSRQYLLHVIIL